MHFFFPILIQIHLNQSIFDKVWLVHVYIIMCNFLLMKMYTLYVEVSTTHKGPVGLKRVVYYPPGKCNVIIIVYRIILPYAFELNFWKI